VQRFKLFFLIIVWTVSLLANAKQHLNNNSTVSYLASPAMVDSMSDFFLEGIFYGRFRLNSFSFDWDEEVADKRRDHQTMGVGGSLTYQTAYLDGWGATAGLYTSQNPWHSRDANLKYYKVGKGVMSRYKVATQGEYGLTALAQSYLEYRTSKTSLKIGRQVIETQMTKTNDIKMIPNTFEGITLESKELEKHKIKLGLLTKQKLRDHDSFHHLFAYDDGEGEFDKWRENDDTAMHQGMTLSKLREKGIQDRLLFFEIANAKDENWNYMFNYTLVPQLFASSTLDLTYQWEQNGFIFSPSFRYMHQFDHGAGKIGGANLKTNTIAYRNKESVEADLYAVRFDVGRDNWRIRTGLSKIADKADIISPWRAFPTNGYGYTLLQYNWYSNTTSYVVQGDYNFGKENLHAQVRIGIQDFDDQKSGVQADSNVFQLDLIKSFDSVPNLYAKLRMVRVVGDSHTFALDGKQKLNPSYKDIRFELNYLF